MMEVLMKLVRSLFEPKLSYWSGATISSSILCLASGRWGSFLCVLAASVIVQSAIEYFVFRRVDPEAIQE